MWERASILNFLNLKYCQTKRQIAVKFLHPFVDVDGMLAHATEAVAVKFKDSKQHMFYKHLATRYLEHHNLSLFVTTNWMRQSLCCAHFCSPCKNIKTKNLIQWR